CQIALRGEEKSSIDQIEYNYLLQGLAQAKDTSSLDLPPWLSEEQKRRIEDLSELPCFKSLPEAINEREHEWQQYNESNLPETNVPYCWEKTNSHADSLRELLLVKCFRPDR